MEQIYKEKREVQGPTVLPYFSYRKARAFSFNSICFPLDGPARLCFRKYMIPGNLSQSLFTHPRLLGTLILSLALLPTLTAQTHTEYVWTGAVTSNSALIKVGLTNATDPVELLVSTSPQPAANTAPRLTPLPINSPEAPAVATFPLKSLQPATLYHYQINVQGAPEARRGQFRTFPAGAASFRFTLGSCSSTGSNHPVFQTILAEEPLFHLITGDFHYQDIERNDPARFRDAYMRNFASPGWQALLQSAAVDYVWDDHDYGPNNSDGTSRSKPAAQAVYRQMVPHYPLPDEEAIYHSFAVGRAYFIVLDTRSERFATSRKHTMLGDKQMRWLKQQLQQAGPRYKLLVLVSSSPWIAKAGTHKNRDNWGAFPEDRREIADFLVAHNLQRKICLLAGDSHMLAIDDGTNNTYGGAGFPVFQAAALDRGGSVKGGPYSHGTYPGGGQYGLMEVIDQGGDTVTVNWFGKNAEGQTLVQYSFSR
jgi:alkaline phosphatase D